MATARADKAVLRLTIGVGLATLIAYGLSLPVPFLVCVLTVLMLWQSGPPIPFLKGVVMAVVVAVLLVAGVLMVPLLKYYAVTGLMLTAIILYAVFVRGARNVSPLTSILAIAVTIIPAVGVAEQALVTLFSLAFAAGISVGVLVGGVSHVFFPDPPDTPKIAAPPVTVSLEEARWQGLQATVVVMPAFVLALTNPAFYVAIMMKTVMLGQQASSTYARSAGYELVGSTLMGAWMAMLAWGGLSMQPNLWMLVLWIVAATLWAGAKLFGVLRTSFTPSFWRNALVTMLILLGPAIEDAAVGKDVYWASAIRVTLFIALGLYAWAIVWVLERWRVSRSEAPTALRHNERRPDAGPALDQVQVKS